MTRAIVLDMVACYGTPMIKEGTAFNRKEIDEQAKRQGLEIKKGDVVLFRSIPAGRRWQARTTNGFLRASLVWARTARSTWLRKKWWQSVPTPGRWKPFPLKKCGGV